MDVQIEHRLNTLPWSGGEVAMVAKARIVHEEIDMDFLCGKPFHEGEAAVVAGEICDKNSGIEAGVHATEIGGEFFQAIVAPGHKNNTGCVRSELAGKFAAKPGGSSRNKCCATFKKSHRVFLEYSS
jgi:hypothetical protein